MKTCPYCAEEIQDAAIVCKHCGRDLAPQSPPAVKPPPAVEPVETAPKKSNRTPLYLLLIGLIMVMCWLAFGGNGGQPAAQPVKNSNTQQSVPTKQKCATRNWTGRGDDVVDIGDHPGCSKISFTHAGQANFIVTPFDYNNDRMMTYVNEIGNYKGTSRFKPETRSVEIDADGSWTMTVE